MARLRFQGFMLASQVLYYWSLSFTGYFGDIHFPIFRLPTRARMTSMGCNTQHFSVEMLSDELFTQAGL
jgi:hypothetical protein